VAAFFRNLLYALTWPLRAMIEAPWKLFSGSRRLARISLPAQVALAAFLFLLICVSVTLVIFIFYTRERAFVWAKLTMPFFAIVTALVVLIPLVFYRLLRLWLEVEVGEFPDIQTAWEAGLAELQRRGLDIREIPLFLVLGTAGTAQAKTLFDASRLNLTFRDFPNQETAALHWFAAPDAVYLVLSDVGALGNLAQLSADREKSERDRPPTALQPEFRPGPPPGSIAGQSPDKTIRFGQGDLSLAHEDLGLPSDQGLLFPSEDASGVFSPQARNGGTLMISDALTGALPAAVKGSGQDPRKPVVLDEAQVAEQERRMEFLGHLVRRARQPVCPINGVLTLLPFWLIRRGDDEAKQLGRVVRRDLAALVGCLRIRCPVTALVVGLDEESGFCELVRRVGEETAASNRIGKGFELRNQPANDALTAMAEHACGSVEESIYSLFRGPGALNNPGNVDLSLLLCKLRLNVLLRLKAILAEGYGFDAAKERSDDRLFFGGCYFAGLGKSDQREAFVKKVVDKLPEQQGFLAWSPAALAEDNRRQLFGQLVLVVDTLLFLGILAAFVYRYWWPK
jgi:hypothetical protein